MPDQQSRAARRFRLYGPDDLAAVPLFAGGFINFGYWRGIPLDAPLSVEQRVASQRALYRLVLDTLAVGPTDHVIEVGCGQGVGSALAVTDYHAALVRGVDVLSQQIDRARQRNAEVIAADPERLRFRQGSASAIPFPEASFTALLSVEAAQHFEDLPGFTAESFRVLRPGGRLVVSTFFATGPTHADPLAAMLQTFADGIDLATDIRALLDLLRGAGFTDVSAHSIGEAVWPGWDRWLSQTADDVWASNWLAAYRRGLLDYYLVSAHKPGEALSNP
ncbi:class I SAM-dependent methyltransferase [Goodfellowiella coeruleoviolacea]|uniref:Methyltransferase domain-containing protein n=1 Tax=Goodfellowiella coeruleoviolacea TaxID=334858 RepID=A0AAE3KF62_9PSEU|nr:methyltransferase domain-containing protein [Goodfellowiella coeruleoviolacea]MCP2164585.1 Methyltransferase domain-containing protein [Goodfellowiella coeruleoviolacea]